MTDGKQALQAVSTSHYDLVLMDCMVACCVVVFVSVRVKVISCTVGHLAMYTHHHRLLTIIIIICRCLKWAGLRRLSEFERKLRNPNSPSSSLLLPMLLLITKKSVYRLAHATAEGDGSVV